MIRPHKGSRHPISRNALAILLTSDSFLPCLDNDQMMINLTQKDKEDALQVSLKSF